MWNPSPPPEPPPRVPLSYLFAGAALWALVLASLFSPSSSDIRPVRYAAADRCATSAR